MPYYYRTCLCLVLIACSFGVLGWNIEPNSRPSTSRRRWLVDAAARLVMVCGAPAVGLAAQEEEQETVFVQGVVQIADDAASPLVDVDDEHSQQEAALYITARPDRVDGIPSDVVLINGKPPPVLVARFANITSFPFSFALTTEHVVPTSSGQEDWWYNHKMPLVLSARWDADGVAATRSPEDLVGRAVWDPSRPSATIVVTGRGAFGRFATKRQ